MAEGRGEPTMDEILASIKKIIADDERARSAPKRAVRQQAAPVDDDILELTETVPDNAMEAAELLDDEKAQSLRHSFSTLQMLSEPGAPPQIVRSGETSLEGLVRDMLRPMLKEWLDTNLPDLVEGMVNREIARITRKG